MDIYFIFWMINTFIHSFIDSNCSDFGHGGALFNWFLCP